MLLVFDLDFTLWDCGGLWVDCTNPPYRVERGKVYDASSRLMRLYPDVPDLLGDMYRDGVRMAIASRTSEPSWAIDLLKLMRIDHYFSYQEIYPSTKTIHFTKIQQQSGIEFKDMYFFDDEYRNIDDVSRMGVNCLHVKSGVTRKSVLEFIQYR